MLALRDTIHAENRYLGRPAFDVGALCWMEITGVNDGGSDSLPEHRKRLLRQQGWPRSRPARC